ncbi:multidrug resistance efflux pump-like protein [Bradyrhizobium oligotrophicum S58]|uniref:Multidrug resistance efflux pump-like protein n=1 Tax=Bradyrhizobium oligotrophicum S58 TaxID=1245469 RepID=M4Z341_9BRAD|nr:multidrug resistance efflux pump-like protein [Bradyrhizobium oligotrophicum]BAM87489.1 multidrug resistance efflux pump-like protein [Bradyrhizobium oligotrophicum S58]
MTVLEPASAALNVSQLHWSRLRNLILISIGLAIALATLVYLISGGVVLMKAAGMVTRERIAIGAPYLETRVREVFVRPGDRVEAGQKIALVESTSVSRTLAELAVEKARLSTRIAAIEARQAAIGILLPAAEANARQTQDYLDKVSGASRSGLVVDKFLTDTSSAAFAAAEKLQSLNAERASLAGELATNQGALKEITDTYQSLQSAYAGGALYAPVAGYVGNKVMSAGAVLGSGGSDIATIYTGPSFILAYLPDNYLLDLKAGERVHVRSYAQSIVGVVEDLLPLTDAMPPEFQIPGDVRQRGQVFKISIPEGVSLPVDQKVKISTCYFHMCDAGSGTIQEIVHRIMNYVERIEGYTR